MEKTPIGEIDAVLHRERLHPAGTYTAPAGDLPNGVFVLYKDQPHLVVEGLLYPWSPSGYGSPVVLPAGVELPVVTPQSTVNAFRMGYRPQMSIFAR